ncbi:hypothetical protein GCM10022419_015980 [Nonomuraea rosea]|uniref:Uncharacterized protein n=1 Tax=Nonomuraea rosea TaxID=638574 RepID=A0ABP6VN88_9ACTN
MDPFERSEELHKRSQELRRLSDELVMKSQRVRTLMDNRQAVSGSPRAPSPALSDNPVPGLTRAL